MATTRISGKTELLGADIQDNDVMLIEHDLSGDDADKKIKFSTLKTAITSDIKDGQIIDSFADVETALSSKVSKSETAGLLKNDGTVDTNTYATTSQLPDVSAKADLTDLAPSFSTSTAYAVGDYVVYNSDVYRCKTAHSAGAWNSSHFTKVAVATEINSRPTFDTTVWKRLTGTDGNGIFELNINTTVKLADSNIWYLHTFTIPNGQFDWFDPDSEHLDILVQSLYATIGTTDEVYPIDIHILNMEEVNELRFKVRCDNSSFCTNTNKNTRIHFIASFAKHD